MLYYNEMFFKLHSMCFEVRMSNECFYIITRMYNYYPYTKFKTGNLFLMEISH